MTGQTKRRPWLAALLSLICPGLGQVYSTRVRRGFVLFAIYVAVFLLSRLGQITIPPVGRVYVFGLAAFLALAIIIYLGIVIDAALVARRSGIVTLGPWNRKWIYSGLIVGWIALSWGVDEIKAPLKLDQAYSIPSGSMIPTLRVGDYVVAWRGYFRTNRVRRGDIAVFELPADNRTDYIMRIVGLPGDRIQMKGGVLLHIDGEPVRRELTQVQKSTRSQGRNLEVTEYVETLPNSVSYRIWEDSNSGRYGDTPEYLVPPGHYFVLGDNRDHSSDSRQMYQVGFVPREKLRDYPTFIYWAQDWSRIGTPVQPLP